MPRYDHFAFRFPETKGVSTYSDVHGSKVCRLLSKGSQTCVHDCPTMATALTEATGLHRVEELPEVQFTSPPADVAVQSLIAIVAA